MIDLIIMVEFHCYIVESKKNQMIQYKSYIKTFFVKYTSYQQTHLMKYVCYFLYQKENNCQNEIIKYAI